MLFLEAEPALCNKIQSVVISYQIVSLEIPSWTVHFLLLLLIEDC